MAHMIRIGRIDENASGVGSRGYVVRRSGTTVIIEFGKVEAVGTGRTRFYWIRKPKPRKLRYKSVTAANAEVRRRIADQLKPGKSGGYHRLPRGVKICSPGPR